MHKKLKTPYYGTTNLHKRAETWVWVVTDVQNFALRTPRPARCSPPTLKSKIFQIKLGPYLHLHDNDR